MDDFVYFLIIIILTFVILFFGGHNNQDIIEYKSNYFTGLKYIIGFEKKIRLISENNYKINIFKEKNFVNINKYFNTANILIPNFVNCFLIKLEPYKMFNIYNIINKVNQKTHMMIIFNHNLSNNLELIIKNDLNMENNHYGYFYDLEKTISIVGIYHIYNNSTDTINISCFILKKPFWHS